MTLWELRYPMFSDTMSIQLWTNFCFLLISDCIISLNDLLVDDVFRAMHFNIKDIYILPFNKIDTLILPMGFTCHCWWIGVTMLCNFQGVCLHTPYLSELKYNIEAKRNLWCQISKVMHLLNK